MPHMREPWGDAAFRGDGCSDERDRALAQDPGARRRRPRIATRWCGLHPDSNLKQNWFPLSSSPSPTSLSRGRARDDVSSAIREAAGCRLPELGASREAAGCRLPELERDVAAELERDLAPIAGSLEHPLGAGIAGQGPEGATRSNPCWRCYRPHAVGALVGAEGVVLAHLVEEMV
jgi:hypothetical protein